MRQRKLRIFVAAVGVLALGATACSDSGGGGDDGTTTDGQESPAPDGSEPDDQAASTVLTIAADTVTGPLNIPDDQRAGAVCVLENRYPRNSEIVWRARVFDAAGEEVDDSETTVRVELADGQTFDMRYGGHPGSDPTDFFWTTSFDIPEDYPTGTLDYEIVATGADGATGTFKPFNVAPSLLTITDEVLETIEEEEA